MEKENGYVLFEDGYDKDGNEIHKQVYTTYKEEFTRLVLENKKLRKENQQLKQQLAEKEEELKYYETLLKRQCNECKDQYKISFCIEKLEKVKELMRNIDMPNKPELYNNDMFGAGFDSHYIRVEKLIDNQINELKGKVETILTHQHEDKGE